MCKVAYVLNGRPHVWRSFTDAGKVVWAWNQEEQFVNQSDRNMADPSLQGRIKRPVREDMKAGREWRRERGNS